MVNTRANALVWKQQNTIIIHFDITHFKTLDTNIYQFSYNIITCPFLSGIHQLDIYSYGVCVFFTHVTENYEMSNTINIK